MGGNTFGRAERMSPSTYAALLEWSTSRLSKHFAPIDAPRALASKSSHGDLDLLCGWEGAEWGNVKGRQEGMVVYEIANGDRAGDNDNNGPNDGAIEANEHDHVSDEKAIDKMRKNDFQKQLAVDPEKLEHQLAESERTEPVSFASPPPVLAAWCKAIVRELGGTQWVRSGNELSVAVPVRVLDAALGGVSSGTGSDERCVDEGAPSPVEMKETLIDGPVVANLSQTTQADTPETSPTPATPSSTQPSPPPKTSPPPRSKMTNIQPQEPFYQLDLILSPAAAQPFNAFTYAYGASVLLLGQLVRLAAGTRSFTMQSHRAVFRHTSFPGLSAVEIPLTHDPQALCDWLGISYAAWLRLEAETVTDLFAWLSATPDSSRAALGLRRLVAKGRAPSPKKPGGGSRMVVVDEFKRWLEESGWEAEPDSHMRDNRREGEADVKLAIRHPDDPVPLGRNQRVLLEEWELLDAWEEAVDAVRPAAADKWEREQKKRLATENSEKAKRRLCSCLVN